MAKTLHWQNHRIHCGMHSMSSTGAVKVEIESWLASQCTASDT